MQIPSVMSSAMMGVHTGLKMQQSAATNTAALNIQSNAGAEQSVSLPDEMLNSMLALEQVAASTRAIEAADEMVGTIINDFA